MASKERLGTFAVQNIPEMQDHSISINTRRSILLFLAIVGCTAVLVLSVQNVEELERGLKGADIRRDLVLFNAF